MCNRVGSLEAIPVDAADDVLCPGWSKNFGAAGGPGSRTACYGCCRRSRYRCSSSGRGGRRCHAGPIGFGAPDKLAVKVECDLVPGCIVCLVLVPGIVVGLVVVAPIALIEAYLYVATVAVGRNTASRTGEAYL